MYELVGPAIPFWGSAFPERLSGGSIFLPGRLVDAGTVEVERTIVRGAYQPESGCGWRMSRPAEPSSSVTPRPTPSPARSSPPRSSAPRSRSRRRRRTRRACASSGSTAARQPGHVTCQRRAPVELHALEREADSRRPDRRGRPAHADPHRSRDAATGGDGARGGVARRGTEQELAGGAGALAQRPARPRSRGQGRRSRVHRNRGGQHDRGRARARPRACPHDPRAALRAAPEPDDRAHQSRSRAGGHDRAGRAARDHPADGRRPQAAGVHALARDRARRRLPAVPALLDLRRRRPARHLPGTDRRGGAGVPPARPRARRAARPRRRLGVSARQRRRREPRRDRPLRGARQR